MVTVSGRTNNVFFDWTHLFLIIGACFTVSALIARHSRHRRSRLKEPTAAGKSDQPDDHFKYFMEKTLVWANMQIWWSSRCFPQLSGVANKWEGDTFFWKLEEPLQLMRKLMRKRSFTYRFWFHGLLPKMECQSRNLYFVTDLHYHVFGNSISK